MGTILQNLTSHCVENSREKKLIIEFDTLNHAAVQTAIIPDADPVTGDITLKFELDKTQTIPGYYANRFEYDENIDWNAMLQQTTTVKVTDNGQTETEMTSTIKPT